MNTEEFKWLDDAITHQVNRPLIHEDRWNDLKAVIQDRFTAQAEQHQVELLRARMDEVQKALQAGAIRTVPTKSGNLVEWYPNGLNRVLNDRLQHLAELGENSNE